MPWLALPRPCDVREDHATRVHVVLLVAEREHDVQDHVPHQSFRDVDGVVRVVVAVLMPTT